MAYQLFPSTLPNIIQSGINLPVWNSNKKTVVENYNECAFKDHINIYYDSTTQLFYRNEFNFETNFRFLKSLEPSNNFGIRFVTSSPKDEAGLVFLDGQSAFYQLCKKHSEELENLQVYHVPYSMKPGNHMIFSPQ